MSFFKPHNDRKQKRGENNEHFYRNRIIDRRLCDVDQRSRLVCGRIFRTCLPARHTAACDRSDDRCHGNKEAAVSITSALKGNEGITVGNVVGSNIMNILLILGIASVIVPLAVQKSTRMIEIPYMIAITVLFGVLGYTGEMVTRVEGGILWIAFLIYLGYLLWMAKKGKEDNEPDEKQKSLPVQLLMILIGLICIVLGSDFVVDGATEIAKVIGISERIIGLTIVAMGTSLPETAVSVTASLVHNNELAVSNVVGSNIFNLMFVIGVCAIMTPIMVQKDTIARDIPLSVICALLLLGLGYLAWGDAHGMTLGHLDGAIFLGAFAGYIFYMIRTAMKARAEGKKVEIEAVEELEDGELKLLSYPKSILCIVGGAVAIAFGGDMTVDAASRIAIDLGMSQTLVGLTIVSIGTSLPELVTSVVAARKNEVDMAVGNAVGSNIFNILMVLGIASAISPVSLISENVIDILVLVGFSVVVWFFARSDRKITRNEGIAMVAMYLIYTAYIIMR